jgi:hypothetical protein
VQCLLAGCRSGVLKEWTSTGLWAEVGMGVGVGEYESRWWSTLTFEFDRCGGPDKRGGSDRPATLQERLPHCPLLSSPEPLGDLCRAPKTVPAYSRRDSQIAI